jgi:hypothetical protein
MSDVPNVRPKPRTPEDELAEWRALLRCCGVGRPMETLLRLIGGVGAQALGRSQS